MQSSGCRVLLVGCQALLTWSFCFLSSPWQFSFLCLWFIPTYLRILPFGFCCLFDSYAICNFVKQNRDFSSVLTIRFIVELLYLILLSDSYVYLNFVLVTLSVLKVLRHVALFKPYFPGSLEFSLEFWYERCISCLSLFILSSCCFPQLLDSTFRRSIGSCILYV